MRFFLNDLVQLIKECLAPPQPEQSNALTTSGFERSAEVDRRLALDLLGRVGPWTTQKLAVSRQFTDENYWGQPGLLAVRDLFGDFEQIESSDEPKMYLATHYAVDLEEEFHGHQVLCIGMSDADACVVVDLADQSPGVVWVCTPGSGQVRAAGSSYESIWHFLVEWRPLDAAE